MRPVSTAWACVAALTSTSAAEPTSALFDDPPPIRATQGIVDCPAPPVHVLTPEAARLEAHQRAERGTSCWLAGECPPGGDYRDDRIVNERAAEAVAAEASLRDSSLWLETLRRFVTVRGCLARPEQATTLERVLRAIPGVKLVWQEARVGTRGSKR